MSPQNRASKVTVALDELNANVAIAVAALEEFGANDARTLAAWEIVEKSGATVHRQSRLLAGKARGG